MRRPYYLVKPYLPLAFRVSFRRLRARWLRRVKSREWPIDPISAQGALTWPGWPGAKQFALVLTHDVERRAGLAQSLPLLQLEQELGFRSSFNFVPEGEYSVSRELLSRVEGAGFEVGVHDLRHDGKLFWSKRAFETNAQKINSYLREWHAVGFRAGFMLHELEWLHHLNILYDSSTFDTDPFEPQPTGTRTIFPFWVSGSGGKGYVELPYTLVQDFTLFVILQEDGPAVWKQKLDWIAQHGGMALLNTHPDYMAFQPGARSRGSYPVRFYREFLEYVSRQYAGRFWHPLPREMATFVNGMTKSKAINAGAGLAPSMAYIDAAKRRQKIWIDLDNTPHVPFFMPIARCLKERGYNVLMTARDAFQVRELADFHKLQYQCIGRHYGKNKLAKVLGVFLRAGQLLPFARAEKPALGISHGSRAQIVACNLLRIPSVLIADYEFARMPLMMRPTWEFAPDAIPQEALHCRNGNIRQYAGIKEDVYAWTLTPDSSVLKALGIGEDQMVALVRPPATEAHYHNPESEALFDRVMDRLTQTENCRIVLLPRNRAQELALRAHRPRWFATGQVVIPQKAIDGLNLIWHSDFVISGGGTMNRESAALGVPVYSIFRGPTGAVDRRLVSEKRLTMITSVEEVDSKITLAKRGRSAVALKPGKALDDIVGHIESILSSQRA